MIHTADKDWYRMVVGDDQICEICYPERCKCVHYEYVPHPDDEELPDLVELKVGFEILDQRPRKKEGLNFKGFKEDADIIEYLVDYSGNITEEHQICGFTLTYRKRFHSTSLRKLYQDSINSVNKSRIWRADSYNWIMIPELTNNGNLHFHGLIIGEYQSNVRRLMDWWRRNYGYAKPEMQLKSASKWVKYMIKDIHKTGIPLFISRAFRREIIKKKNL